MTLHEFRDVLKKLRFVDRQDWMGEAFWRRFRDDPVGVFIGADDVEAEHIWELIRPKEDARAAIAKAEGKT